MSRDARHTASTPRELHQLFEAHVNNEDLDALASLYEPSAAFRAFPGEALEGLPSIRLALGQLVRSLPRLQIHTRRVTTCGELALLSNRWRAVVPGAEPVEAISAEVARRQPDGTWRYVIDDPLFCQ